MPHIFKILQILIKPQINANPQILSLPSPNCQYAENSGTKKNLKKKLEFRNIGYRGTPYKIKTKNYDKNSGRKKENVRPRKAHRRPNKDARKNDRARRPMRRSNAPDKLRALKGLLTKVVTDHLNGCISSVISKKDAALIDELSDFFKTLK